MILALDCRKIQFQVFEKCKILQMRVHQIKCFVTCAEYNSEMLTYKPLTNNAVFRKIKSKK
jgi:hypothetical protein